MALTGLVVHCGGPIDLADSFSQLASLWDRVSAGAYNVGVRYLGVDPGGRRMGLALADDATGVVVPLTVVPYSSASAAARSLLGYADQHSADCVVIGHPTDIDGARTAGCARGEAIARALEELGFMVFLQSEYLSTREARRRAREAGRPPEQPVDDLAAQVLLEEFLTENPVLRHQTE